MSRRPKPKQKRSSELRVDSQSAVAHILAHCPERIQELTIATYAPNSARLDNIRRLAAENGVTVHSSGRSEEERESVWMKLAPFRYTDDGVFLDDVSQKSGRQLILALDHLQDPQNFGAIARTAEALGVSGILLPKDRSVQVTSGVYNASAGAIETIPVVQVVNLSESLRRLKSQDFWIVGTTLGEGATSPWKMPDFEKIVLVMGAEWSGLSAGIEKLCDWKVQIPLPGLIQSLNVNSAASMLMYEWFRQGAEKAENNLPSP